MSASPMFAVAGFGYLLSMVVYIAYFVSNRDLLGKIASSIAIISFTCQTGAFVIRWYSFAQMYDLGFFQSIPITNLYESLVFFAWCLILSNIILEHYYKVKAFGVFATMLAGMAIAFIDTTGMSTDIQPILPALKSNWLLAHASLSFIAYAAFAISFIAAVLHLALSSERKLSPIYLFWTGTLSLFIFSMGGMLIDMFVKISSGNRDISPFVDLFKSSGALGVFILLVSFFAVWLFIWYFGNNISALAIKLGLAQNLLEEITYKAVSIGFPIFTIGGLIFGAIWADKAWGHYWSWDPKETWSLITWLIYAFYLHGRYIRGWQGQKVTVVAVIGFLSTIFTYVGVNILLSGLHSYGSF